MRMAARLPQSWSDLDLNFHYHRFGCPVRPCEHERERTESRTQLVPLRDWAQGQSRPTGEYIDLASGKDLNRPAWKRLTADWRAGRIHTIAVLRLNRAFRSVSDMH